MPFDLKVIQGAQGYNRGIHELHLKNIGCLKSGTVFESPVFEVAGVQWKTRLQVYSRGPDLPLRRIIYVFSCEVSAVQAGVGFGVKCSGCDVEIPIKRKFKKACPSDFIDKFEIPLEEMTRQCNCVDASGELIVSVDLKDVETMQVNGRLRNEQKTSTVNLAVATRDNIRDLLYSGSAAGHSWLEKMREPPVYSRSSVKNWANCDPNSRYWLHEKDKNGNLQVTRCLSYATETELFEDICVHVDGGIPWVVVFKEERKSNEVLPPIDKDSIMIFCTLSEPPFNDLSHVDYFIAQPSESCRELFERIKDADGFPDCPYRVILTTQSNTQKELKDEEATLEECGIFPGAVLDFQRQGAGKDATSNVDPVPPGNSPAANIPPGDGQQ